MVNDIWDKAPLAKIPTKTISFKRPDADDEGVIFISVCTISNADDPNDDLVALELFGSTRILQRGLLRLLINFDVLEVEEVTDGAS